MIMEKTSEVTYVDGGDSQNACVTIVSRLKSTKSTFLSWACSLTL